MEMRKYEVQTATDKLEAMNQDAKLSLKELSEANALDLKGLSDWVSKERAAKKEPALPASSDSHEAAIQYRVEKNSHDEMKGVLDRFDSEIAKLRESYAASKEELRQASKEEISKLEVAIGIAPEKKELLAGIRPGDKVEVVFQDGKRGDVRIAGTFSKVENGNLFIKSVGGKERDLGPLHSVRSVEKFGDAPVAAAEASKSAKPETGKPAAAGESAKPTTEKAGEEKKYHEVKKGETLSKIAKEYSTTYQELALINKIADPNKISIGQKIELPAKKNSEEAPAQAPTDGQKGKKA